MKNKAQKVMPSEKQIIALLLSLRKNFPEDYQIDEKYILDFHTRLDELEKESGEDYSAFRIPDSEIKTNAGFDCVGGWSKKYCDRDLFLQRLEAVLVYLSSK